jgi:hypothetical protein
LSGRTSRDGAGSDRQGARAAMIPIPSGARVWLVTGHTDMRKGFDGLALIVQETLRRSAFRPSLRFSRPPRVSDQVSLERRPGLMPVLKAIGARTIPVAIVG